MPEQIEKFYPVEANLGKNCQFWNLRGRFTGCNFPKAELEGRTSCEGVIDDVCLFIIDRKRPNSLTGDQINAIKTELPNLKGNPNLPTGDIK